MKLIVAAALALTTAQAQANTCGSAWVYNQYIACENPDKPIKAIAKPGQCPGAGCEISKYKACPNPEKPDFSSPNRKDVTGENDFFYQQSTEEHPSDANARAICEIGRRKVAVGPNQKVELTTGLPFKVERSGTLFEPKFNHLCKYRIYEYPGVVEVNRHCEAAEYVVRTGSALERRKECKDVENPVRVQAGKDVAKPAVEGLASATCMSCDHLDRNAPDFANKQVRCVGRNVELFVMTNNPAWKLATDEDQKQMAKAACESMDLISQGRVTDPSLASKVEALKAIISSTKTDCSVAHQTKNLGD